MANKSRLLNEEEKRELLKNPPPLINTAQMAILSGVTSRQTIRNWAKKPSFPRIQLSGKGEIMARTEKFFDWLEQESRSLQPTTN